MNIQGPKMPPNKPKKKKLNPIIRNILQRLEIEDKDDIVELKAELSGKQKRLMKTIMTVERGLAALRTKEKYKGEKELEEHLAIDPVLKKYLFKKVKQILKA